MAIAIHVRTRRKIHSSIKKIIRLKFSFFQENILHKDNHYLKEQLNNRSNLIIVIS